MISSPESISFPKVPYFDRLAPRDNEHIPSKYLGYSHS